MGKLSFGTTGLSYEVDKVALKVSGAPKCPRCSTSVYFNEEKKAHGKSWHTRCFTCAKCNKRLDSTNANNHENEVYCTACHRREFGPKGYGFAGGAAGLSTESTIHKVRAVESTQTQAVPKFVPSNAINRTDPECCPRCGKRVYFAEEVKAMKRKWHRLCFKCGTCNKMLEPGRCSEHNMELYCQACYGRQFGPKGYGYAGGAGQTLSSDIHPYYPNHRHSRSGSNSDQTSEPSTPAWRQPSSSGTPSPGNSSTGSMPSPPAYANNPNSIMYPTGQSTTYQAKAPASNSNGYNYNNNHNNDDEIERRSPISPSSSLFNDERVGEYNRYASPNPYSDVSTTEEAPYSRARPAPPMGGEAPLPKGLEQPGSSKYYGAKEWNEPVFL